MKVDDDAHSRSCQRGHVLLDRPLVRRPEWAGLTRSMPSQHDWFSWTRAALKPDECMAAIELALASWAPSKMLCSLTQTYSVPEV
jgi:hypothetical protein